MRTTVKARPSLLNVLLLALTGAILFSGLALANPHGRRPQGVDLEPLFQLKAQNGGLLERKSLRGRPAAIFFGYTHCPDVCPTTLLEMSQHLEALGNDGDRLQVVFVTIDPERDTADHLKEFVGSFDRRIIALTGTPLEIAAVAHRFGATYDKVVAKDGSYTMDHTTKVFLLDRYGLVAAHLERNQAEKDQRDVLRRLLSQ